MPGQVPPTQVIQVDHTTEDAGRVRAEQLVILVTRGGGKIFCFFVWLARERLSSTESPHRREGRWCRVAEGSSLCRQEQTLSSSAIRRAD